jgi:Tfp pilus assembly protein PilZ
MSRARTRRARKEKRAEERVAAVLPAGVGGAAAMLHNVSASGMYLETDAEYAVGSTVDLALDLDTPWGQVMVRCQGRIVRLQPHDHKVGVAVQFVDGAAEPLR